MTAIVGLVRDGRVYVGGDSAGVTGWSLTVRADSKVFTNGPYVMGFTSSFRMGQLLRYAFKAPHPKGDLDKFMTTTFVNAVRQTLKQGGWLKQNGNRDEGGTFLVGVSGRLFTIAEDFQVGEAVDGYAAVGCGHELALGALHATAQLELRPRKRVRLALRAAERYSAGVRGPFSVLEAGRG
ncbi:hypothetical protein ACKI1J_38745 [Streptomyces scabiei]|uniref:hypothetical protein n=1 Tax=Streptomyces scabiei TaxID=1930 RepID=UPI0039F06EDB